MAKQYIDYNPYRADGSRKQQFVEPIQSMEDYQKVIKYLSTKKNKRNLCIFVLLLITIILSLLISSI